MCNLMSIGFVVYSGEPVTGNRCHRFYVHIHQMKEDLQIYWKLAVARMLAIYLYLWVSMKLP